MRFSVKIISSCIWVAMPVDWVILHWYACGADGRSGGRSVYGHVITKFFRMGSLPHFLTHSAPLRALRARELRIKPVKVKNFTCSRLVSRFCKKDVHIRGRHRAWLLIMLACGFWWTFGSLSRCVTTWSFLLFLLSKYYFWKDINITNKKQTYRKNMVISKKNKKNW